MIPWRGVERGGVIDDDGPNGVERTLRVSDTDRERVAQRLARAEAEGRLALVEFDERVRATYGALTRADLAPLTADLPTDDTPMPAPAGRAVDGDASSLAEGSPWCGTAAAAGVWATVSTLNVIVWAVVALTAAGPVYPWWIWVAGPWGAMLALRALAGRAGTPAGYLRPARHARRTMDLRCAHR